MSRTGRPKLKESERHKCSATAMMTKEELMQLDQIADRRHKSRAETVREAIFEFLNKYRTQT